MSGELRPDTRGDEVPEPDVAGEEAPESRGAEANGPETSGRLAEEPESISESGPADRAGSERPKGPEPAPRPESSGAETRPDGLVTGNSEYHLDKFFSKFCEP